MKYKLFILAIVLLIMIPCIMATEDNLVLQQNKSSELLILCYNLGGDYCNASANCKLNIFYPNGSYLLFNNSVAYSNDHYNYTLSPSQTVLSGTYNYKIICNLTAVDSWYYSSHYDITPNGEELTTSKAIFYLGLMFTITLIMLFLGYLLYDTKHYVAKVSLGGAIYLFSIGLTYIAYQLVSDFLTGSPFLARFIYILWYLLMIGLTPVVLLTFALIILFIIKVKELEDLGKRGLPLRELGGRR